MGYFQSPVVNPDFGRWNDITMDTTDQRRGATAPNFQNIVGNIYANRFDNGATNEIHVTVQMPHTINQIFHLRPHVHFMPDAQIPAGQTVRWVMEYVRTTVNGSLPGASTTDTKDFSWSYNIAANVSLYHPFDSIPTSGFGLSDIFLIRLARLGAVDTFGGNCWILGFDFHYQIENAGGSSSEFEK